MCSDPNPIARVLGLRFDVGFGPTIPAHVQFETLTGHELLDLLHDECQYADVVRDAPNRDRYAMWLACVFCLIRVLMALQPRFGYVLGRMLSLRWPTPRSARSPAP